MPMTHTQMPSRVEAVDTTDASTSGRSRRLCETWKARWLRELTLEGIPVSSTPPTACRNGLPPNHYRSGCIGGTHQRPRWELRLKSTGDLAFPDWWLRCELRTISIRRTGSVRFVGELLRCMNCATCYQAHSTSLNMSQHAQCRPGLFGCRIYSAVGNPGNDGISPRTDSEDKAWS